MAPLFIATFVISSGNGVVFPLLADLQDEHGLPTYGLGIISSAAFLAALVGQLTLAGQADRGRAKLLLLGGVVVSAVSLVLFALASELWQFVGARALSGLAIGCFLPATRARSSLASTPTTSGATSAGSRAPSSAASSPARSSAPRSRTPSTSTRPSGCSPA